MRGTSSSWARTCSTQRTGLPDERETALAEALGSFVDALPDAARESSAWHEVAVLLERLGAGRDRRELG